MYRVRPLTFEELDEASRIIWKSYYRAEKDLTSLEGMTVFRDLVEPLSLKMNALDGSVLFFGAFREGIMVGVGALKEKRRVLLLYVLPEEQGRGAGSAILRALLSRADGALPVTVNAAPGAVGFYRRFGFVPTEGQQEKDGIRFVPMVWEKG